MAEDDAGLLLLLEPPSRYAQAQIEARVAGYGWDEIDGHIDASSRAALAEGYTQSEIDDFLGRGRQETALWRVGAEWRTRLASDETLVSGLQKPSQSIPLTPLEGPAADRIAGYANMETPPITMPSGEWVEPPSPTLIDNYARGSYARALLTDEVRSPRDFAERYTGALGDAAPELDGTALVRAAQGLAAHLPSDRDFIDRAIAIAGSRGVELTPESVAVVRENLIDAWADTGEPLDALYRRAYLDSAFGESLISRKPDHPSDFLATVLAGPLNVKAFWDNAGLGLRDVIGGSTQLVSNMLPESFTSAINAANNSLVEAGVPLSSVPAGGVHAMERERLRQLKAEGERYLNDWPRFAGEVLATLPLFSSLGLSGAWGWVAAGATGGATSAAFHPSDAEDYWTSKAIEVTAGTVLGGAIGAALPAIGKAIASMTPKAAEMLRRVVSDMSEPKVRVIDPGAPPGMSIADVPASQAMVTPKPAERMPLKPAAANGTPVEQPSPLDFVPEAKPAEKMQALGRDWLEQRADTLEAMRLRNLGLLPDEFSDPHFFQKLAAGQDPPTQDLARGMDTASGVYGYLADLGGRLMRDESGGLYLFKTTGEKAAEAVRTGMRDFMQEAIIKNQGAGARFMSHTEHLLDPSTRRLGALIPGPLRAKALAADLDNAWARINPHMKEWEAEIAKGPAGNPMTTMIGNMIAYIEGRSAGVALRPDSPLTPVANAIRDVNKFTEQLMRDAERDGLHTMKSYYDDYFRHMWEDPNKADQAFGVGRLGSSASFNLRTIPTVADGLAMGLKPKIAHPLELTLTDAAQKIKYIQALRTLKEAETANVVYWSSSGPLNPADVPLQGVGSKRRGPVELQAYAHRGAATAWNDWINVGFYNRPGTASMYDKLLYMKNTAVGISLLGPGYHMAAMVGESLTSSWSKGLQELVGGEIFRGLYTLAKTPIRPIEQVVLGHREMAKFREMVNDPVINILAEAGAWVGPRQNIYKMGSAPNILQSILRKELGRDYAQRLKHIVERDPNGDLSALQIGGRSVGFVGHEVSRVLTTVTAPLFDFVIPRLKIAANVEQMQTVMRQNPTASPEWLQQQARQIVKNTDDRLGEMNMDNIFWPKMVKQSAQVAMISPSWVYGFGRMTAAAAQFNIEKMRFEYNPHAARGLIAMMMTTALINTTYQYLMTGEMPWDSKTPLHDIIAPRAGGVDPKTGAPERTLLPGQIKELMDYARIVMVTYGNPTQFGQAVTHYINNKLPSHIQIAKAFITGEDAIGHHVTTGPKTFADFMLRATAPIFFNSPKDRKVGTGIPEWQNWIFGVRPAMPHVANPNEFFRQQEHLQKRFGREDYRRQIRENKYLETPKPLPTPPEGTDPRTGFPPRQSRAPSTQGGFGQAGVIRGSRGGSPTYETVDPIVRGADRGERSTVPIGPGGPGMEDTHRGITVARGGRTSRPPRSQSYEPWRTRRRSRNRRRAE